MINRTKKFTALALMIVSCNLFAQREADKKIAFDSKIETLFFHEFSAVPIILTDKTVAGIDPETGEKIWEIEGDRLSLLGGAIQEDKENYQVVPFSPYIIVDNLLVDTRDGKIIVNKENNYKSIISYNLIPELKSYLIQCKTDDKEINKVFLVELSSNSIKWEQSINISKKSTIKNISYSKVNTIAFTASNNFLILNSNTGTVIKNEEEKIGAIYQNPNGDTFYAVEAAGGGLGSMMGAALTMNVNKMVALGDKIYSFNASSGDSNWKKPLKLDEGFMFSQEVDGKMFIQHEKAGSVYDYATGEPIWKRSFEKRKTNDIEKNSEGYLVYYGARKMQLDDNGKEQWKKPQYNGDSYLENIGEDDSYDLFEYSNGSIVATSYRIAYYENGVKKAIWKIGADEETKIAYDAQEKNLIVLDGKNLYILNPDRGLTDDNKQKLQLKKHKDFNLMEVRGENYFLSSPWEYAIIDKSGSLLKTKYFVQPGEAGRKWLNTLSTVGSVAGSAYQMSGLYNVGVGGTSAVGETFTGVVAPGTGSFNQAKKGANQYEAGYYGKMASEALYNPNRLNAFSNSKDYSFYFTKDDAGTKYLAQVSKDSGEEVDKFIFLDNKPNYHVDQIEKRVFYTNDKEAYIFDYK
ncbi:PQQ-binding-like beta-propeller repeat protein [Cellulophaga sp. HaHaR_3_176]|uniref:PQQ-binding-like beta-propeller repeat protein n=1 Tax=Cellulophaga sp. HaHaR_3_176 TaxID=1942464 RepID=UPI001C1FA575|nr:PQQ-binding-like beta-propeller repeat protein [Cellulophaga sp. HaHaR_3_176]QWX85428.1 PQQ-binding-like beta-propeller repeat protein [Cellulophaga sp. HaHaR_3_176]